MLEQQYKVLVKEKIADSGVDMLRERFSVDVGVDWTDEELAERIGGYHGILIRSATRLTADLIDRADNLRASIGVGRSGKGVRGCDTGDRPGERHSSDTDIKPQRFSGLEVNSAERRSRAADSDAKRREGDRRLGGCPARGRDKPVRTPRAQG